MTGSTSDASSPGPRSLPERSKVAVAVLAVAVGAAGFAIAFRSALSVVYRSVFTGGDVLEVFRGLPGPMRVLVPATGGLLVGLLARASGRGGGVGDVMEAVVLGRTRLSLRQTLRKALGSWLAIASGGSIGREGPLIQFGGSLGSFLSAATGLSERSARAVIASGTAAGFAAAYNTPFAAVLFVLEIVTGVVVLEALLPVMVATVIATAITRAVVGGGPIYGERGFTLPSASELGAFALLGVVAAFGGQAFMRLLALGERFFEWTRIPQPARAAIGGAAVGVLALRVPEVTGNGFEPLDLLLDGAFPPLLVLVILVSKALATTASVASGSPGGVFTPSLLLGGAIGALFGHALGGIFHLSGAEGSFALVGMAAVSAATTHAPMMAAVLVFEVSADYALVLPLVLATAIATLIARRLHPESLYTAELRRRGVGWEITYEGHRFDP